MPPIIIDPKLLVPWGKQWFSNKNPTTGKTKEIEAFDRQMSVNFASCIDRAIGDAFAVFLNNKVEAPKAGSLLPTTADCVEVGPVRIIGGIRPQNFDVAYRPDGPRIVFDSKSLNDTKSIGKNWQNMINDIGTEATTVHTRYPYAVVAFTVILPRPALRPKQEHDIVRTLTRLCTRKNVIDPPHLAEAISLIVWDPKTGLLDTNVPDKDSPLNLNNMGKIVETRYSERYQGLPPHNEI
jgi:hypothetical protein